MINFEELAIAARTDHHHLGRISVGIHVHDDESVFDGMDHLVVSDAVPTCRAVKLRQVIGIRIIVAGQARPSKSPPATGRSSAAHRRSRVDLSSVVCVCC